MGLALTIAENKRHVGLRDAESFGYFGLRHRSTQHSDFRDFFSAQKLLEMGDESSVDSVLLVESVVSPFKVGRKAVRLYAVDMVDHREIGRVGNECHRNEAVDVDSFGFPLSPQADLGVSNSIDSWSEVFPVASLQSIRTHAHSINASDAAKVADFVVFTKHGDGDASPFFDEHNMGPFARSAHIIASFCGHQGD